MNERDTVFNKRIGRSDIDSWIDIPECFSGQQRATDREGLMNLLDISDDIMCYMTTLNQRPIGGTMLFRDRYRLGMGLIGVRMLKGHTDALLPSTIKASLPFFRTASIRDVDAIVSDESNPRLPFPHDLYLSGALRQVLNDIGFEQVQDVFSARFHDITVSDAPKPRMRRSELTEEVREFVWKNVGETMIDCSHTWLSLLRSSLNGCLCAISPGEILAILAAEVYADGLVVSVMGYAQDSIDPSVLASAVAHEAAARGVRWVDIQLLGKSDDSIAKQLEYALSAEAVVSRHSLMRRGV
ncbi:hypothetical protein EU546_02575 [Candidatus Thorarchaeota archaeon]|nr:MAG: hypothetical protein EU546_02575 [Candidatus Thorarchaeota archaeon]